MQTENSVCMKFCLHEICTKSTRISLCIAYFYSCRFCRFEIYTNLHEIYTKSARICRSRSLTKQASVAARGARAAGAGTPQERRSSGTTGHAWKDTLAPFPSGRHAQAASVAAGTRAAGAGTPQERRSSGNMCVTQIVQLLIVCHNFAAAPIGHMFRA